MTERLSRAGQGIPAADPVRIVHLGLGAFHRAHQAWYTHAAGDGSGIASFTGRRPDAAIPLRDQDGLYTLIVRGSDGDKAEIICSISAAHDGADLAALTGYFADERVTVVTTTITEAGYCRNSAGDIDLAASAVAHDVDALKNSGAPGTGPGRLLAGLLARRRADAGPMAIVPCDNLSENGAAVRQVMTSLASTVDPSLVDWMEANVRFISTMVDRITPATTDADRATARELIGAVDETPVVGEPFTEWILTDDFIADRPAWERAGARLVADVTPFETRKLWLLNGSHSLLAYAAPKFGHRTVAQAIADDRVREWVNDWWDAAATHLTLPERDIADYRKALLDRYANPRIQHFLAQIAADGSQKLPVRIVPVLRAERAAGRLPHAAVVALAGWVRYLRAGDVRDPRAAELAEIADGPRPVDKLLAVVAEDLAADSDLVSAITAEI